MNYAGAAFIAYALASTLWSPGDNLWAAAMVGSAFVSYGLGQLLDVRIPWITFLLLATILALSYLTNPLLGWPVINFNQGGAILAIALVGAIVLELWFFIPILGPAVIWVESRTAIIATAIGVAIWGARRFPVTTFCIACGAAILAVALKNDLAHPMFQRWGIWQDSLNHLTLQGSGLGSYKAVYATWSPHTNVFINLPDHAYNDYIELLVELGIGTIPLWFFLAFAKKDAVVWTFLILSLTFWPFWLVPLPQMLAFHLGSLNRASAPITLRKGVKLWPAGV